MRNKKWVIGVAILVVLGFVYGLYLYNKPVQAMNKLKPDYNLTADQLYNEFDENETVASENYLDKVIAVTGIVSGVEQSSDQVMSVRLKSDHPVFGVLCELESGKKKSDLSEGDEITFKGICTGKLMDVVLVRCIEM